MDKNIYDIALNAAEFIKTKTKRRPDIAVILGSGFGDVADRVKDADVIPYNDIPGFPRSDVAGHAARLVIGELCGKTVAIMQGRAHYYEGHSMSDVAFPMFALRLLGIKGVIVTNACGGINEEFSPGDLMLITDHVNLTGTNPLIGANDERFGPRFPDMTEVYDRRLINAAENSASKLGFEVKRGVYAFFPGPCYETAAEIRAYKALGADAVGMSTVPEATAACYLGMRVAGVACITNMATGIARGKHSHGEVLAAANAAGERMGKLVSELIKAFDD